MFLNTNMMRHAKQIVENVFLENEASYEETSFYVRGSLFVLPV